MLIIEAKRCEGENSKSEDKTYVLVVFIHVGAVQAEANRFNEPLPRN